MFHLQSTPDTYYEMLNTILDILVQENETEISIDAEKGRQENERLILLRKGVM